MKQNLFLELQLSHIRVNIGACTATCARNKKNIGMFFFIGGALPMRVSLPEYSRQTLTHGKYKEH